MPVPGNWSGVIASEFDRLRYEDALALPVRSVRLVAGTAAIEARLRHRYTEYQDPALIWHLQRHCELSRRLALNDLDEIVVDTEQLPPRSVAREVLNHFDSRTMHA